MEIIMTFATVAIACYAVASYKLSKMVSQLQEKHRKELEQSQRQHQEELNDLYKAIVVATIVGGSAKTGYLNADIDKFKEHYKPTRVKIFE